MKRKPPKRRVSGSTGTRIRALRDAKGWKQDRLADELGVHLSAVSHWERGQSVPDMHHLTPLADLLGTTVAALIEGEKAYAELSEIIEAKAS